MFDPPQYVKRQPALTDAPQAGDANMAHYRWVAPRYVVRYRPMLVGLDIFVSLVMDDRLWRTGAIAKRPTSSSTLFMPAWSFARAMAEIEPKVEAEGFHHFGAPFGFLAGFSCELAFKAFCRGRGATDQSLFRLGHDLKACQEAALASGLKLSMPADVSRFVDLLQRPHAEFLLRYTPVDADSISLPRPQFALDALGSLLDDVFEQEPSIRDEMPR